MLHSHVYVVCPTGWKRLRKSQGEGETCGIWAGNGSYPPKNLWVLDFNQKELDKLLEDAPLPFIMQHATKISSIRKRVSALNLLLKSIQRRIDNIDRMLSTGIPNDNVPPDIVETSSPTL
ncbi:uncharacterized protein LOC103695503 isoform X2 [Phoenix dactylifera]|uniref:Biogenesis of lysosome-related organelles complex 1 subunit 7 n=1 Tax=Phoenix dactylifera TaxID=42345 RepID=A0A8B9ANV2_PHODC|nr:uncharacterized protein LOC103695503 isoform X2 [Phoenix dactylifera]